MNINNFFKLYHKTIIIKNIKNNIYLFYFIAIKDEIYIKIFIYNI